MTRKILNTSLSERPLNDDIWLKVFGYLGYADLLRIRQVSKPFKKLATNNSIWREQLKDRFLLSHKRDQIIVLIKPKKQFIHNKPVTYSDSEEHEALPENKVIYCPISKPRKIFFSREIYYSSPTQTLKGKITKYQLFYKKTENGKMKFYFQIKESSDFFYPVLFNQTVSEWYDYSAFWCYQITLKKIRSNLTKDEREIYNGALNLDKKSFRSQHRKYLNAISPDPFAYSPNPSTYNPFAYFPYRFAYSHYRFAYNLIEKTEKIDTFFLKNFYSMFFSELEDKWHDEQIKLWLLTLGDKDVIINLKVDKKYLLELLLPLYSRKLKMSELHNKYDNYFYELISYSLKDKRINLFNQYYRTDVQIKMLSVAFSIESHLNETQKKDNQIIQNYRDCTIEKKLKLFVAYYCCYFRNDFSEPSTLKKMTALFLEQLLKTTKQYQPHIFFNLFAILFSYGLYGEIKELIEFLKISNDSFQKLTKDLFDFFPDNPRLLQGCITFTEKHADFFDEKDNLKKTLLAKYLTNAEIENWAPEVINHLRPEDKKIEGDELIIEYIIANFHQKNSQPIIHHLEPIITSLRERLLVNNGETESRPTWQADFFEKMEKILNDCNSEGSCDNCTQSFLALSTPPPSAEIIVNKAESAITQTTMLFTKKNLLLLASICSLGAIYVVICVGTQGAALVALPFITKAIISACGTGATGVSLAASIFSIFTTAASGLSLYGIYKCTKINATAAI